MYIYGCGPNTFCCLGIVFSFRPRRRKNWPVGGLFWGPMLGFTAVWGPMLGFTAVWGPWLGLNSVLHSYLHASNINT